MLFKSRKMKISVPRSDGLNSHDEELSEGNHEEQPAQRKSMLEEAIEREFEVSNLPAAIESPEEFHDSTGSTEDDEEEQSAKRLSMLEEIEQESEAATKGSEQQEVNDLMSGDKVEEEQDLFSPMLSVYKRRRQLKEEDEDEENNREERWEGFRFSLDLIVEVLKKLPAKSLVRFQSVSKEWSTIISSRRDFINSIVTRSLAQPPHKLPLFIFFHCVPEAFFTVSSSFSQSPKHAVSLPRPDSIDPSYEYCYSHSFEHIYARGLICCYSSVSHLVTIYNPTTRQSVPLPVMEPPVTRFQEQRSYCHFGYDPVMNQYKVLSFSVDDKEKKQSIYVFTLGGSQSWRKLQGIDEKLLTEGLGLCVDGIIYYVATRREKGKKRGETVLLSFDIRSERFDHVWAPESMLRAVLSIGIAVNHLGKLGFIGHNRIGTSLWILENAEKQEWSKITLGMPDADPLEMLRCGHSGFSGVTPAGEIFVTEWHYFYHKSVYVYYYDTKQNSFRRVEIQGTSPENIKNPVDGSVCVFPIHDHVENTMCL
uniref:F-box protein n=1 Tax=Noccaea caerulescens TaxID=107243 RepID=A0A1J3IYK0_NOCCA